MTVKLTIVAETDDVLGLKERIAYALEGVEGIRRIQVPDIRVVQEEIK